MALSFSNSTPDYLAAGSAPATAAPLTLACWVRPTSTSLDMCPISVGSSSLATNYFIIGMRRSGIANDSNTIWALAADASTPGGQSTRTTTTFSAGDWIHVAAVFTSSTVRKVYIAGVSEARVNQAGAVSPVVNAAAIGAIMAPTPFWGFEGDIAEAGIWNVALSDSEIAALAKWGRFARTVRPGALASSQPMRRASNEPGSTGTAFSAVGAPAQASTHPPVRLTRPKLWAPAPAPPAAPSFDWYRQTSTPVQPTIAVSGY